MSITVTTMNIVISYVKNTIADITFISGQHSKIQSFRYGKRFKCGTRLIGVADTRVSPHAVQQFLLFVRRLRPIRSHLLN